MGLKTYQQKRNFRKTPEPNEGVQKTETGRMFVVQKHASRRLHYDLRLEADGVLMSWAVPKGPSYNPEDKRLAVHVEDHPIDYGDFEGTIPEHEYGAGTVMVWDRGIWQPLGDWKKEFADGKLTFRLSGQKLHGTWKLVRIKKDPADESGKENWLLMKADDAQARLFRSFDVTAEQTLSVKTGRSMEKIRAGKGGSEIWEAEKPIVSKEEKPATLPVVPGRLAPWPETFFPELATLVSRAPEGSGWLSEIKYDGYRLLAWIKDGSVVLTTRTGQDWTGKFTPIAGELSRLPVRNAILDGEVVVMDPDGTTNFQRLQNILKGLERGTLVYYVFDLPYFDNHDLTNVPLIERKSFLREVFRMYQDRVPSVRYSGHLLGSGERVLRAACRLSVEGIVAKRVDSLYVQKRSRSWVKRKCVNRQEFVVGGYTDPSGSRSSFGSLILGYYNNNHDLVYCGNVGTGFNSESIKTVYDQLKKLKQKQSPFPERIPELPRRGIHWVAPQMVVEVEFSNWTEGGHLRHPSFQGIREDKNASEITREKEIPPPEAPDLLLNNTGRPYEANRSIRLSNPEKVLYPEQGLTKKDLADYYTRISRWILPELINRPLVLVRCPQGIGETCFYQKHFTEEVPDWIRSIPIREKDGIGMYSVIDDLNGLLSLVQLGVLEIHTWGCHADDLEHPDRMVFDLDPSPEVPKERLIEAIRYITEWLKKNRMKPFLKTTGGKGIHIVVPLKPSLDWEEVKTLSGLIAKEMVRQKRDWFVATVTKKKRTGKILVDYFRNSRGATSILPYSTRARPGAPVALPIAEDELREDFLSHPLNVTQTMERLDNLKQDPWEGIRTF